MNADKMVAKMFECTAKLKSCVKNKDSQKAFTVLECFFSIVDQLPSKIRKIHEPNMFGERLRYGMLLCMHQRFEEARKHLLKGMETLGYSTCEKESQVLLKRWLVESTFRIALNKEDRALLLEADKLAKSLKKIPEVDTDPNISSRIIDLGEIIKNCLANEIVTVVEFRVPFPIHLPKEHKFGFFFEGIEHDLETSLVQASDTPFSGDQEIFIEATQDKYGTVNKTQIILTIHKYINPLKKVQHDIFSEHNTTTAPLDASINALNYFIDRYKLATGQYWLDNVCSKMITNCSCKNMTAGYTINCVPVINDNQYVLTYGVHEDNKVDPAILSSLLMQKNIPLWQKLLLESKDNILRGNNREAITCVNSALENYIFLRVEEILSDSKTPEEVASFFHGTIEYSTFYLKEYLSIEQFEKEVQKGNIKPIAPSVYGVINEVAACGFLETANKKRIRKLVSRVRSLRNPVIHGHKGIQVKEKEAREAIDSFIEITKLLG